MQYDEFISQVRDEGDLGTNDRAAQITTVVLEVLGQRLSGGEADGLAAQLPAELKAPLDRHTGEAEAFDVDDFLRRIADVEERGSDPEHARVHARAVLTTVARTVSTGELDNLRSQLPAGYSALMH